MQLHRLAIDERFKGVCCVPERGKGKSHGIPLR
jgi:hypothetical protein